MVPPLPSEQKIWGATGQLRAQEPGSWTLALKACTKSSPYPSDKQGSKHHRAWCQGPGLLLLARAQLGGERKSQHGGTHTGWRGPLGWGGCPAGCLGRPWKSGKASWRK